MKASPANKESVDIFRNRGGGSSRTMELFKRRRRSEYIVFIVRLFVFAGDFPSDSAENDGISRVKKLTRFWYRRPNDPPCSSLSSRYCRMDESPSPVLTSRLRRAISFLETEIFISRSPIIETIPLKMNILCLTSLS